MKKWWIVGLVALTILSLAAGILFIEDHGSGHWWARIPGFFILFAFAGGILLVVFSKYLGRKFLSKDEGYYKDD
ncbi:hypothetical protein ACFLT9_06370 [Acidobacteriota bacterium]